MNPDALVDFHVDWHLRERSRRNDVWLEENAPRCLRGHVLNPRNLYLKGVYRQCRQCRRDSQNARSNRLPRVSSLPIQSRIRWLERRFSYTEIEARYGIARRQLLRVLQATTIRLDAADDMVTKLQMEPACVIWPEYAS